MFTTNVPVVEAPEKKQEVVAVAPQPATSVVVDLSKPSKKDVWDFIKEDPDVETLSDRMKQFSPGKIVAIFKTGFMSPVVVDGLDCNQAGPDDLSFLMWIIGHPKMSQEKKLETLGLAILHGADVNYVSKKRGDIPVLFVAIACDNIEVLKVLGLNKANFKYTNSEGINALIFAVSLHGYDIVDFLSASKAVDLDAEDARGITALMLAASSNDERMVKILLARGADPRYISKKLGCIAYAFAVGRSGYENVAKLLDPSVSGKADLSVSSTALSPSVSSGSATISTSASSKDDLKTALEHAKLAIEGAARYIGERAHKIEQDARPVVKEVVKEVHNASVDLNQAVGVPLESAAKALNTSVGKPLEKMLFRQGGVFGALFKH